MSKFDDYLQAVESGAKALIKSTFSKTKSNAQEIFDAHLKNSREKLKRWTEMLAKGQLTEFEFKVLVKSQVTLGKMRINTIKVIGKKQAIDFRENLRSLFVNTAVDIFL